MPKYIIHIGPPKTGSKYLQSILFHSREKLVDNGILYPNNWWTRPDEIMHAALFYQIREKRYDECAAMFRKLNASRQHTVVISCEGFTELTPDDLCRLRDAIGEHPVEIVFYCRRWSERIPSDWQQIIKMGRFPTLPEFYLPYLRAPSQIRAINYSIIWKTYAAVFGRESLRLVSYSNLRDRGIDLAQHFSKTFLSLSTDLDVDERVIQRNVSPDLYDTETLRLLNYLDFLATGRIRLNMRVKFLLLRDQVDIEPLKKLMEPDIETLKLSDGAEVFGEAYRAISAYSDRMVSPELGAEIFDRGGREFLYVRCNYLANETVGSKLKAIYNQLDQTPLQHPELS